MVEDDVWKRAADQARQDLVRADRRPPFTPHLPKNGLKDRDHQHPDDKGIWPKVDAAMDR